MVDQTINSDDFIIVSPFNATIQHFYILDDEEVEYLPRQIVEKFPNMKKLSVTYTGLTVVRGYFFKKMRNLRDLVLSFNKITTFEADAFEDLVSVKKLWLHENMIQTLDEKLFAKMVSLEKLWLQHNRIEFLSPTTFKIPNTKLLFVALRENVCYLQDYNSIELLESEIHSNCSIKAVVPTVPEPANSKRSFIPGECNKFPVGMIFLVNFFFMQLRKLCFAYLHSWTPGRLVQSIKLSIVMIMSLEPH